MANHAPLGSIHNVHTTPLHTTKNSNSLSYCTHNSYEMHKKFMNSNCSNCPTSPYQPKSLILLREKRPPQDFIIRTLSKSLVFQRANDEQLSALVSIAIQDFQCLLTQLSQGYNKGVASMQVSWHPSSIYSWLIKLLFLLHSNLRS